GQILTTTAGTVDSQSGEHNSLTLTAGTGSVSLNANLGSMQRLNQLTVTRADSGVTFGGADTQTGDLGPVTVVSTVGQIDIGSTAVITGTGISLNGGANPLAVTTTGGSVRLNGAVTLSSDVVISTDAGDTDLVGGNITFTSSGTID